MTLEHTEIAKKLYNSKAWKDLRELSLNRSNGMCERCLTEVADIVHHVTHINSSNMHDPNVTLNLDNTENLCITCHNQEHFGVAKVLREGLTFDSYGNVIEINKREGV